MIQDKIIINVKHVDRDICEYPIEPAEYKNCHYQIYMKNVEFSGSFCAEPIYLNRLNNRFKNRNFYINIICETPFIQNIYSIKKEEYCEDIKRRWDLRKRERELKAKLEIKDEIIKTRRKI